MDMQTLVIMLVLLGLSFYALERAPVPANPPWLRRALEAILALAWLFMLMDRAGVHLPGVH